MQALQLAAQATHDVPLDMYPVLHWLVVHCDATVQDPQFEAHWIHAWLETEYPVAQTVQFVVPLQEVHPVEQTVNQFTKCTYIIIWRM